MQAAPIARNPGPLKRVKKKMLKQEVGRGPTMTKKENRAQVATARQEEKLSCFTRGCKTHKRKDT